MVRAAGGVAVLADLRRGPAMRVEHLSPWRVGRRLFPHVEVLTLDDSLVGEFA